MSFDSFLTWYANFLEKIKFLDPWLPLFLFLTATVVMIWRLESMGRSGIEGTVLGTLVMPYCSGFSNLIFAFVMGKTGGNGSLVLENCLVNNVTNMTLLIGLPAVFWSLDISSATSGRRKHRFRNSNDRLNRLSLLLTIIAALFFVGTLWALAYDGKLDFGDGLVLVGVFLFWQIFHVFDVLKSNVRLKRSLSWYLWFDFVVIVFMGYLVYIGIDRLVAWIPKEGSGLFVFKMLGWLSGLLMVLPNALLAFYYTKTARPDVVYSSQIGDGHICIPMCIGLFALFEVVKIPHYFQISIFLLFGAGLIHTLCITFLGKLPRFIGLILTGAYGFFVYKGLISP
jgi:cation:H+ antiporter